MLALIGIALRRPYTFTVAALLVLLGTLAAPRMSVDIFPSIDISIIRGSRRLQLRSENIPPKTASWCSAAIIPLQYGASSHGTGSRCS